MQTSGQFDAAWRAARQGAPFQALLALAAALAISALVIALAGANPLMALRALADGAFGSAEGWSEVGVRTCPLLLAGLAVAIAFRAGIWNIGAEGQLVIGALAVAWLGARAGALPTWIALPLVLGGAALGGALWASIAGLLRLTRNVDEVISTIMLNFIAVGLVGYLVHGPLLEAAGNYPQTDAVAAAARLPRLIGGYRVHAGLLIAFAAAGLSYLLLFRTVMGYEMRAAGLNRVAAHLAGLRIARALLGAMAISGALAGLAGGIEVSALTFRLYDQFSPGYGFTAIAVALLGRLHPAGIAVAALFFAALDTGSTAMQSRAGVSSVLVSVIQATVIFCLIAVDQSRWRPSALGNLPAEAGVSPPYPEQAT
jgi:simple sugar transport system permease protein